MQLVKEDTDTNIGDLMTKHLPEPRMVQLLKLGGFEFRAGRAVGAPELARGAVRQRLSAVQVKRFQERDAAARRVAAVEVAARLLGLRE